VLEKAGFGFFGRASVQCQREGVCICMVPAARVHAHASPRNHEHRGVLVSRWLSLVLGVTTGRVLDIRVTYYWHRTRWIK
jgi:hypothetical protein